MSGDSTIINDLVTTRLPLFLYKALLDWTIPILPGEHWMEATPAQEPTNPAGSRVPDATIPEAPVSQGAVLSENGSSRALPEAQVQEEQAEEVDVWWGSYAARTLTPSFVLCGLFSVAVIGVALYLGAWHGGSSLVRYSAHAVIGTLWLIQLGRWAYRVVAINYRLTTRHLYIERGFRHPGKPGIELAQVRQALVARGRLERWLGVGRICIFVRKAETPVVLEGVRDPERIALKIRQQVEARPAA